MSKISNQSAYPAVTPVDGDYIIGTDVSDSNSTKTFLYSGIFSYINDKLTDPSITPVYASEKVLQEVRFAEAVSKGDPVYISGYNTGQNRPEVSKADASDAAQMPSIGLASADYSINTNGYVISVGDLTDIDTDALGDEGDIVYVASGGGLTVTKPTGSNLIQNVGKISRSNQSNGSIEVFSVGRTNDVPNLSVGKIWVGSAANTIESTVVHLDETNDRLGINETSPTEALDIDGNIKLTGGIYLGGTDADNLLDDYEEGTFTPTLTVTGSNTSISSVSGRYTKVGDIVQVEIFIRDFLPEDETCTVTSVTNLPFTVSDNSFTGYAVGTAIGTRYTSDATYAGRQYCYALDNTTTLNLRNGNLAGISFEDDTTTEISAFITYKTS